MKRIPLGLLIVCAGLGCTAEGTTATEAATKATKAPPNANSMTCVVAGKTLMGTGEQVEVGSFGTTADTLSLSLSLTVEQDGEEQRVSTGLLKVPAQGGSHSFPAAGKSGFHLGEFERRSLSGSLINDFQGSNYWLFYAPTETGPDSKLAIVFSVLQRLPTSTPGFSRLHLRGTFSFNAAHAPKEISAACLRESMQRRLGNSKVFPLYNAQVCGAELVKVSGKFDVTEQFLAAK